MWKCPGCDKDFGRWGDEAPCVIPECQHIMCRDCCEKKGGKCATCEKPYFNPKCTCVCGAEKYFQPDHNALRLLDEARAMEKMLEEPVLTQKMVASWSRGSAHETFGDSETLCVNVKMQTGKTIVLKDLFKCDLFYRVMLMMQRSERIPVDQQRYIFNGKQLNPEDELGRAMSLSAFDIENDSTLHMVLRLRGC